MAGEERGGRLLKKELKGKGEVGNVGKKGRG